MSTFALGQRSLSRLEGVHPDLVRVVKRAIQICECDFMVVEGLRTLERQRHLVNTGKSKTLNSRHLTGHAVDLCAWVDNDLEWGAPEHDQVAKAMKAAAAELGVEIQWGGDWTSFVDTPHYQLSWKAYPKQAAETPTQAIARSDDKTIAKHLAKTSTKYKTATNTKRVVGGVGAAVIFQQIMVALWDWFGGLFNVSSLDDILATVQVLSQLGNHFWFAILIGGGAGIWRVMTKLQQRQVAEVKHGTYEPSEGTF